MEHHNKPEPTALQCDIVKNVFSSSVGGVNCCERKITSDFIDAPSKCLQGGWPHWVLNKYQFSYEWVNGAIDDWETLKGEICKVGPIISVIEWRRGGKHTFIVKGYQESPTNTRSQKVVQVYDPLHDDPQDLTFDEFVGNSPNKDGGESYEFSHVGTYVQISPKTKDKP